MASTSIDGIRLESPLIARSDVIEGFGVSVRERPFRGHVNVRGQGDGAVFREVVESVAGVALPLEPNRANAAGERVLFWLGPTEWLLTCPGAEEIPLSRALDVRLAGEFASVVPIGGGQTVLELEGDGARDLLAKGLPARLASASVPGWAMRADSRREGAGAVATAAQRDRADRPQKLCRLPVAVARGRFPLAMKFQTMLGQCMNTARSSSLRRRDPASCPEAIDSMVGMNVERVGMKLHARLHYD